jgi:multiple antibiotic resistance protein
MVAIVTPFPLPALTGVTAFLILFWCCNAIGARPPGYPMEPAMSFFSAALLMFLVFDPAGNIIPCMALLKTVPERRRLWVIAREMLIALVILIVFMFGGRVLLQTLQLDQPALGIAGGIILFLIALRMIFPSPQGVFGEMNEGEPYIVPLATPLVAGPSAVATIILMMTRAPERWPVWLAAVVSAWGLATAVLLCSAPITRLIGPRLLMALERLMGLLLTVMAAQMFLNGVRQFMAQS